MGAGNYLYQWEGDTTQSLNPFTVKGRKEMFPKRLRFLFGRILFEEGDLAAYWALVETRNDTISRNKDKISEGSIDPAAGRVGGGFYFGTAAIALDVSLETVPTEPTYAGDLSLQLKVYVDGTLQSTKTIYHQKPFRLGVPVRGHSWEVELVGNVDKIHQVILATSVRELMSQQQEGA